MAHTYASIFFHLIWSTKDRFAMIQPSLRKRLYTYIGGIIKNESCDLLSCGGTQDHVHLLIQISPKISISDLTRCIKANSSRFVNQNFPEIKFAWQEGYGAFSVSVSKLETVRNYIARQDEHHKKISFLDEVVKLFEKHEIEYDKRYLFK